MDRLGFIVQITADRSEIESSDLLIMPGVGTFPVAMESLEKKGLIPFLNSWVKEGRPLLGICLGMQILANSSTEILPKKGLGFIDGNVFPLFAEKEFHIGWNQLNIKETNSFLSAFDGIDFYFNHSFAYEENVEASLATTKYMRAFPSIVKHGQVIGLQFHPEKSQGIGKDFFAKITREMVNGI